MWSLGCVLYEIVTLKPPFRAENMEGLYNKVIKGQFSKISEKYSNDLWEVLVMLLQVHPENRPNCDQILKNNIVAKRIKLVDEFKNEEAFEESNLLQTIKIPKNLLFLTDKLPKSNYEKDTSQMIKNQSFSNKQDLLGKSKSRQGVASDDETKKKKIKMSEVKKASNENSIDLGNINAINSNRNRNKSPVRNNNIIQDLVILPKIKNEAPLNLIVRNDRYVNSE
jgi:NIMA (never in mitosis gene a)-related kinase